MNHPYPGKPINDCDKLSLDCSKLNVVVIDRRTNISEWVFDFNPCGHILIEINDALLGDLYFHIPGINWNLPENGRQRRPHVISKRAYQDFLQSDQNLNEVYRRTYTIDDEDLQTQLNSFLCTLSSNEWHYGITQYNCQTFVKEILEIAGHHLEDKIEKIGPLEFAIECPTNDVANQGMKF